MPYPKTPAEFAARALESFEAGFKTLTAKKDALSDLGRAYEMHAKVIQGLCLDAGGPDRQMTPAQNDVYWGLPSTLNNWRPKHAALVTKVFPQLAQVCADIGKLVELRTKLNDAEVAPKGPTKVQRDEAIRLSATGKVYAEEFGKMRPGLEKDFEDYIEREFKRLADKYGSEMVAKLGASYGRYGKKLPEDVKAGDVDSYRQMIQRFLTSAALNGGAPSLNQAYLKQQAEQYAKGQIEQFVVKLTQKLGDLTEVSIRWADAHGFECEIDGKLRGHDIRVKQSRKFVVNQQGTMFHQWPALIYVDRKFTTEAAFKRLSAGV